MARDRDCPHRQRCADLAASRADFTTECVDWVTVAILPMGPRDGIRKKNASCPFPFAKSVRKCTGVREMGDAFS